MSLANCPLDSGTGYGRKPPSYIRELTEVGPGTPMGELLRRYWHPVALTSDATGTPLKVRALGEDLVLFRDGAGRAGLVYARCAHRGTTLYYGKVEERGIRCCYHGWLFDAEGHCLEQPCEPEQGRNRDKVRQPWYPLAERYGLLFAYMGPPERKPVLPRYEILETLAPDEEVVPDGTSIGSGGGVIVPCNWMQHFDNLPDHFHVYVLHSNFSGTQFVESLGVLPEVEWEPTDKGVKTVARRRLADGKILHRVTEAVLPTLRVIPDPLVGQYSRCESIGWVLPMDDTHFRIYSAFRRKRGGPPRRTSMPGGKRWHDMSEEEHRRFPGDWEAQVGQGEITYHSEEHMGTTDRGMIMLRRMFRQQLEAVAAGKDPIGISFDPDAPPVRFVAENALKDA